MDSWRDLVARTLRFGYPPRVWVRGAAIRPVPPYAVLGDGVLAAVERELGRDGELAEDALDAAFERFDKTQPQLSEYIEELLERPLDETALALGHFLVIAVWMAFDRSFGPRLGRVTTDALAATIAAVTLEEELRAEHAEEPLDLDDVMAFEQPRVLSFVNEHVDAALEVGEGEAGKDTDVDDVHTVYKAVVIITLALSHAVTPDAGSKVRELLA